ncbi:hypothetical protein DIURU_002546 [Diutina rugosa]|uniref:Peroxisomal membrane protein PEX25 n=1 Tax=Diutina rugosa TaxID=5481 RepID=A0A642UPW2_DIURU|nr:uncharacterized protein DIURU_002546 [Diutina rugosa]KAA8903118.1 hypothetical protein DIURU_002546 [Diutina rugosa]
MSATTVTRQQHQVTTPSKQSPAFTAYITPESDRTDKAMNVFNMQEPPSSPEPELTPPKQVSNWDVWWKILNTILGKDKLAKFGQYLLRLVLYHAHTTQTYLSDATMNIDIINSRYNDSSKKLDLLKNFIKHPQNFMSIVLIFVSDRFISRFSGFVGGLSMYRQFLRFGKTPFRIRDIMEEVQTAFRKQDLSMIYNLKFLDEVIALYYGIFDELMLLFKLRFYTSKRIQGYAARHESLAWYYMTILALYNTYHKLSSLSQREIDLKVQIEVKRKARQLSKRLLSSGGHSLTGIRTEAVSEADLTQLDEIQFNKNNAWLDVYKNIADLVFNTYTVFSLPLPFPTIQIWMGLAASGLSTVKIYRETKRKMQH